MIKKIMATGLAAGLLVAVGTAQAAEDPIATRQAIMASVGAAAALAGSMMKSEIAYSPVAGKSAIATMNAASHSYGAFFPDGSNASNTKAAEAIWDKPDGFAAELAKFNAAAEKAMAAAGKKGPADLDAFKAAMGPVFGTCKSCHETYRKKN
ncbi:High-potential cytochrome c [Roseibium album]|nr:High-potential cytochrome c [Roseibium album]